MQDLAGPKVAPTVCWHGKALSLQIAQTLFASLLHYKSGGSFASVQSTTTPRPFFALASPGTFNSKGVCNHVGQDAVASLQDEQRALPTRLCSYHEFAVTGVGSSGASLTSGFEAVEEGSLSLNADARINACTHTQCVPYMVSKVSSPSYHAHCLALSGTGQVICTTNDAMLQKSLICAPPS